MEYLYYFTNASLTQRIVEYLHGFSQMSKAIVTVINFVDGWVIKVKINSTLNLQRSGDLRAFLNELGIPYEEPPACVNMAIANLEAGQSPLNIMRRYQVVVVSHGSPQLEEIKAFRQQFIRGL